METNQTKTKDNYASYGIADMHKTFDKKYPKSFLGLKGKQREKPDLKLCKKITKEYFDIFFKDLYLEKRKSYFLFGGTVGIYCTPATVKKITKNGVTFYNKKDISITIFWYGLPTRLFYKFFKMSKLTGSTNMLPVIEKLFRANFSLELLPKFDRSVVREKEEQNLLYLRK